MKLHSSAVRNSLFIMAALLALAGVRVAAQTKPESSATGQAAVIPARITQAIDEARMVQLKGNVHPLARGEFDQGAVSNAAPMKRMLLLLQRSPEQEAALQQLMAEQMSKESPNFHKWLTPEEFGRQFGPADADIQTVTSWLTSHGFTGFRVNRGKTVIEFNGNVGQVRSAFHTDIHKFVVNGDERQANTGDPQIPAALTPVVAGIVSLHNFPMKSMRHSVGAFTRTADGRIIPELTGSSNQFFAVGPADFAKIYNIPSSLDGTGGNIAILGFSSIDLTDTHAFRALFGLPVNDPVVVNNGPDPGFTGEEGEADLDVQWSGAVAPKATIHYVSSEGTVTSDPLFLGAEYVIDNNSDDVMSLSFGQCEASLGNAANAFFNTLWEQAAAQGITVTVSSGDPGSAGCDDFNAAKVATHGLAVSGIASTPFNIAVGGTDFDDVGNQAAFWNQNPPSPAPPTANDPVTRLSAKGYIPETTWNDSCAATATPSLLTTCVGALATNIVGGSGGPSAVYTKPSWQNGLTPADSHRDIPDISLFASDGPKSQSFYVVCQADAVSNPSSSCASSGPFSFLGVGGTSASAPAFAGIIALIGQSEAAAGRSRRQGNANFVLYKLGQTASNFCNSSTQPLAPPATCVFYDVTKGNISVPCAGGSPNCSSATSGTNGVLVTTSGTTQTPAFTTGTGYDLATGLGTVNVTNLATAWGTAVGGFNGTTTTLLINNSATPAAITHGTAVTAKVTVAVVAPATGTPTGDVSVVAPLGTVNGGNNGGTLLSGTVTISGVILPGGTYSTKAHYAGDGTFAGSDSTGVPVVVNKENSGLQMGIVTFDINTGNITNGNATAFAYGSPYILRMDVLNSAGTTTNCKPLVTGGITSGCAFDATGTITLKDNGSLLDAGTFPVNSEGHAEDQPIQLAVGSHPLTAVYSGDNSYNASVQVADNLTVTKATTTTGVASLPSSITSGTMVTLTATISTQSSGVAPSGTVQFLNGATPITGTVTLTPTDGIRSSTGFASLKATLTTTISALMPPRPMERTRPGPPVWWFVLLATAMAAFVHLLGRFPKQRKYVYASMILFGVILTGVAGCGGGGGGPKIKTVTIQANYSGDSNYNSSSGQVIITIQ
jgi:pro-kumamolisin-like protein/Big-like domain-containing protein